MSRILWVDDEVDLLQPYIIYLKNKGYEVVTASNGEDALCLVESQKTASLKDKSHFDIVFLDENMPGMSGLETLQEIKRVHPELPVVMITKSEEEHIMEQAIGEKIADYLIKPVNPSQILLCLKKHIHQQEIVTEQVQQNYRQEWSDISYMIDTASTIEEWQAIERTLSKWDLELENSPMRSLIEDQRTQANVAFAKWVARNYEDIVERKKTASLKDESLVMSQDVMKHAVFPLLDKGEKVLLCVIDNFRYDQWKTIQPLISEFYTIRHEEQYTSILPTATQYARNAIFSGLLPLQIKEMYPQYWVEEGDEETKNQYEKELVQTLLDRYRRRESFNYWKINESDFCERVIGQLKGVQAPLNIVVLNFIDMLSHSRTESKMMRELANDEAAYRSLTLSWFRHSPTYELLRRASELGFTLVLTTDHGTTRVKNAVQIIADKNTNTNIRYKVGKALNCNSKNVFFIEQPKRVGLPCPNVSSSYAFCAGSDFFAYPNQFNYYAQYYRNTFQHGGISLEEMIIPLVTLEPKSR
ncbi:MAG: PglZ domain-containing protein [Paludibacteraceae bacterium]|nr:PglZ domain-containing protein [Paludibacteraceae bacterium]